MARAVRTMAGAHFAFGAAVGSTELQLRQQAHEVVKSLVVQPVEQSAILPRHAAAGG
jgi:hypothetical protein